MTRTIEMAKNKASGDYAEAVAIAEKRKLRGKNKLEFICGHLESKLAKAYEVYNESI